MNLILRNGRIPGHDEIVDVEIGFEEPGQHAGKTTDAAGAGFIRHIGYIDPATAATRTVDLGERWLIPGLWDNHVHFSQWSQVARRFDVSLASSAAEAADAVAGRIMAAPPTGTLIGYGFRDGLWEDAPSFRMLDAVSRDVPVVLVSADLHCVWLNSAALSLCGFGGHPTGVLREEDAFQVERLIDTVSDEVLDDWVDAAARTAAARGVVGVVDLEMTWSLDAWTRRIAAGSHSLRVDFGIYTQHLERAIELGLRTGAVIAGTNGLLTVGPYKVITDGSLNTRTAYCFDEYPGREDQQGSRGLLTVPTNELLGSVRRAAAAGIRPAVHAIGDHANSLALDVFEQVGCTGSIEHAQLLSEGDFARFASLGVVASVQPEHAMDDRDVADRYWEGRTGRAFVLAGLLNAGAELALGSDAPVAPLDPWVTMAAAVGRTRDGREPWHPEQAISRQAALAASARGRHQIEVGDVADLAVTEIDPFTASVDDLRRMPVAATLLEGRFTHSTL
ncbi:amidohydrolase [Glaciibacter superstes]|uniref:amidohydrolase n=1 Tax=Glaciibacter superstes TaxID=501023 RepID=UPI0003B65AC3|nr:amidohydrolase [Glaciibacter superstes]